MWRIVPWFRWRASSIVSGFSYLIINFLAKQSFHSSIPYPNRRQSTSHHTPWPYCHQESYSCAYLSPSWMTSKYTFIGNVLINLADDILSGLKFIHETLTAKHINKPREIYSLSTMMPPTPRRASGASTRLALEGASASTPLTSTREMYWERRQ